MNLNDMLDRPIAFQRAFVSLGAGITGALMLSQAIYWSNRTDNAAGWFYKTMEEWEAETGMTRSEQESARKKLVKAGVLEEMKKGVPCRLFYRVNMDAVRANLLAETPQSSLQESCKQGCRKYASKPAGNLRAITETTTEITAETTADTFPALPADAGSSAPEGELVDDAKKAKSKKPTDEELQAACRATWDAYSAAYEGRYGAAPIRNAKVNSQVKQLVGRIPREEAPAVAAFYVGINDAFLIRNCHDFGSLLAKAETFRTQWATGRQVNGRTARQIEDTQANINAAQEAAARIMARQEGGATHGNPFLR